jgi:hypothetical protein
MRGFQYFAIAEATPFASALLKNAPPSGGFGHRSFGLSCTAIFSSPWELKTVLIIILQTSDHRTFYLHWPSLVLFKPISAKSAPEAAIPH